MIICFTPVGTCGYAARKGILFQTSGQANGILVAILVDFSLGKACFLAILVKEMSNFCNSCK